MQDSFIAALWQEADILLGVAGTTSACRNVQQAHSLQGVPAVAVSRLVTGVALLRFCAPRAGSMSLQLVTSGPLHQIFADVTAEGHLRAYCKGTGGDAAAGVRVSTAHDVGRGLLSVLRTKTEEEFTRSTIELVSGEIDVDLANYATQSEQVPTILVCDALVDEAGDVLAAGGMVAQALPGARAGALDELQKRLDAVAWLRAGMTPAAMLAAWQPQAETLHTQPLRWQCRCSQERAEAAVQTLSRAELTEMVAVRDLPQVGCEFCGQSYKVSLATLKRILAERPDETLH